MPKDICNECNVEQAEHVCESCDLEFCGNCSDEMASTCKYCGTDLKSYAIDITPTYKSKKKAIMVR